MLSRAFKLLALKTVLDLGLNAFLDPPCLLSATLTRARDPFFWESCLLADLPFPRANFKAASSESLESSSVSSKTETSSTFIVFLGLTMIVALRFFATTVFFGRFSSIGFSGSSFAISVSSSIASALAFPVLIWVSGFLAAASMESLTSVCLLKIL